VPAPSDGIPTTEPGVALPAAPAGEDLRSLADAVTRLRRSLRRAIRPEYPWESLPMAQVEVLQLLEERPGIAVGEVASTLRLASNTVSTLVGQLLREGLVLRTSDDRDRRIGRLTLSDDGVARLTGWRVAHEHLLEDAVRGLDPVLQQELLHAVQAIDALGLALLGAPEETPAPEDGIALPRQELTAPL
jgi:DNA-binding MarR family transcriptional regulator